MAADRVNFRRAEADGLRIGKWINRERELIPRSTIEKAPSAELATGPEDETACRPRRAGSPF